MSIRIHAYGLIADILGAEEKEINGIHDTESLRRYLIQEHHELGKRQFIMAIGNKITGNNHVLNEGEIVALLPPFSGG